MKPEARFIDAEGHTIVLENVVRIHFEGSHPERPEYFAPKAVEFADGRIVDVTYDHDAKGWRVGR